MIAENGKAFDDGILFFFVIKKTSSTMGRYENIVGM